MAGMKEGWSRVTGGLTEVEARWYAEVSFFESTAMPDVTTDEKG